MKKEVSQGAGVAIGAVAVIGLLVAGYFMFLKPAGEISPEDTRRMMGQNSGGGPRPGGGGTAPMRGRPGMVSGGSQQAGSSGMMQPR